MTTATGSLFAVLKAHEDTHAEEAADPIYVEVKLREWRSVWLDEGVVIGKQQDQDTDSYVFRCEICDQGAGDLKPWTYEPTDNEWMQLEWV